jgi:hypothetical protein
MQPPRNLWPLGIFAALAMFIFGTATLIVFASSQKGDLVSPDYYEQEIKYQTRIDSLDRAKELGTRASARCDAAGQRIVISLPVEHVRRKVTGQIQLYRPSAAELDRQFKLELDSNGAQSLDVSDLPKGLWKVRVSWSVEGREYFVDQKIVVGVSGNR